MGIGATYNNLTLNVGYGFGFLNNGEKKGKTKSFDLQAHLFPYKWALDVLAIRHKGVYSEQGSYVTDAPENSYYRPDIQQLFIDSGWFYRSFILFAIYIFESRKINVNIGNGRAG